jgi:hypothetical protein
VHIDAGELPRLGCIRHCLVIMHQQKSPKQWPCFCQRLPSRGRCTRWPHARVPRCPTTKHRECLTSKRRPPPSLPALLIEVAAMCGHDCGAMYTMSNGRSALRVPSPHLFVHTKMQARRLTGPAAVTAAEPQGVPPSMICCQMRRLTHANAVIYACRTQRRGRRHGAHSCLW